MSLSPLTKEQALQKLRHYCAYQERSHKEVKEKLYSFGLHKQETEQAIAQLIEEGYLNEERFAIQFAGGKFRMKQWGKVKIRHELKLRQVSEYCIKKALQQIDEDAYQQTLEKEAEQRWEQLRGEKNIFTKKRKLQDYLLQKGFESDRVAEMVKKSSGSQSG
ncbi:MAG: regulatory protein RecX [Williamsia sp.]|nr:regulatory protein RecX [Williamsia sp.]